MNSGMTCWPPEKLKPLSSGNSMAIGTPRMSQTTRGTPTMIARPTGNIGKLCPVSRRRFFAHRDRTTTATTEQAIAPNRIPDPLSMIGRGMNRPRLLRFEPSGSARPWRGDGSTLSTALYQNSSCSSSGTLRSVST